MSTERTITSLAILKVNWDTQKKDYIEIFLPFLVHLFLEKKYESIIEEKVCQDFKDEFGIVIPYHPMVTILRRAKTRRLVEQQSTEMKPVYKNIKDIGFQTVSRTQQRKLRKLITHFIDFSRSEHKIEIKEEDAEKYLLGLLEDNSLRTITQNIGQEYVLPETGTPKYGRFLAGKFIEKIEKDEPDSFSYVVEVAIGKALAETILYNELGDYQSDLSNSCYYLDVTFLYNLLGANGLQKKAVYEDLVDLLQKNDIKLFIFKHTLNEYLSNLSNCIYLISNPVAIDFSRASRALKFFYYHGWTESDIQRLVTSSEKRLDEFNIQVCEKPEYEADGRYQIDEARFKQIIEENYRLPGYHNETSHKDLLIQNDIDSISAIYRLRQGSIPRSLRQANYLFITENKALAYSCRVYHREHHDEDSPHFPTCVDDVFIGTLIWLRSPISTYNLNKKKLIADAYAAVQPDDSLIQRYISEVEKLKKSGDLSEDEHHLLRTHGVAINILTDKTLGDAEKFFDRTSFEVLEDITERIKLDERKFYIKEKQEHGQTRSKLLQTSKKLETSEQAKTELETNVQIGIVKLSELIGSFIFSVMAVAIVIGGIKSIWPNFLGSGIVFTLLAYLVAIFGVVSLILGTSLKSLKNFLGRWVRWYLEKTLLRKEK